MTFSPSTFTPPTDQQLRDFVDCAEECATALRRLEFASESLRRVLGAEGLAALDRGEPGVVDVCLLYTSDAADDLLTV